MQRFLHPSRPLFWLFLYLFFVTFLYTTSLNLTIGAERTLVTVEADEFWNWTAFWGDSAVYMGVEPMIAPYKYRIVGMGMANAIDAVLPVGRPIAYIILNTLLASVTATLFVAYLLRYHRFERNLAVMGGLLFLGSLAVNRTALFPMLDIASMFFMLLCLWAIRAKRPIMFLIVSVLAVGVKEVIAITGALWFFAHVRRPLLRRENIIHAVIGAVPFIAFMVLRQALGASSPLEMGFAGQVEGFDTADFVARMFSVEGRAQLFAQTVSAFGFLWIGVLNLPRDRWLLLSGAVVIPVLILSSWALSLQIARPLGIIFPVLIPAFLEFFNTREPEASIAESAAR